MNGLNRQNERFTESDNSRWELDYNDILEDLKHTLKSEKQQQDGKWIRPNGVKPKLNDDGVDNIISDLKTVVNKGTPLANTKEEYARQLTKEMGKALASKLTMNKKKWEVIKSERKSIVLSYANFIYLGLTRSVDDWERKHRAKRITFKEDYKHDEVNPNELGVGL